MRWTATIDMRGTLDTDLFNQIADEVLTFHVEADAGTISIIFEVEADTYDNATRQTLTHLGGGTFIGGLLAEGVLQLHRLTVQDHGAGAWPPPVLSTVAAGARLGLSAARVRQLARQVIGFPPPVRIPGAAGDFYWATDIERFKRSREPGTGEVGRPRATDEPQFDYTLARLLDYPALGNVERRQVEQALAVHGGRYVRGKAKVILDVFTRNGTDLVNQMAGDLQATEGWMRARELWPRVDGAAVVRPTR